MAAPTLAVLYSVKLGPIISRASLIVEHEVWKLNFKAVYTGKYYLPCPPIT